MWKSLLDTALSALMRYICLSLTSQYGSVSHRLKSGLVMQSPPVLKRCFTWGNPKTALFATRTNMRLAIILTEPYFLTEGRAGSPPIHRWGGTRRRL
jgi:hypothetical protein